MIDVTQNIICKWQLNYDFAHSHASCEAWRNCVKFCRNRSRFLLTRLMRGVTGGIRRQAIYQIYFYSHTSCEAWRCAMIPQNIPYHFYSHTSCEAWLRQRNACRHFVKFLLTHLMRGVTCYYTWNSIWWIISTHTPHARRDKASNKITSNKANFYSHTSCEAWLYVFVNLPKIQIFLLTHLMRGVTA